MQAGTQVENHTLPTELPAFTDQNPDFQTSHLLQGFLQDNEAFCGYDRESVLRIMFPEIMTELIAVSAYHIQQASNEGLKNRLIRLYDGWKPVAVKYAKTYMELPGYIQDDIKNAIKHVKIAAVLLMGASIDPRFIIKNSQPPKVSRNFIDELYSILADEFPELSHAAIEDDWGKDRGQSALKCLIGKRRDLSDEESYRYLSFAFFILWRIPEVDKAATNNINRVLVRIINQDSLKFWSQYCSMKETGRWEGFELFKDTLRIKNSEEAYDKAVEKNDVDYGFQMEGANPSPVLIPGFAMIPPAIFSYMGIWATDNAFTRADTRLISHILADCCQEFGPGNNGNVKNTEPFIFMKEHAVAEAASVYYLARLFRRMRMSDILYCLDGENRADSSEGGSGDKFVKDLAEMQEMIKTQDTQIKKLQELLDNEKNNRIKESRARQSEKRRVEKLEKELEELRYPDRFKGAPCIGEDGPDNCTDSMPKKDAILMDPHHENDGGSARPLDQEPYEEIDRKLNDISASKKIILIGGNNNLITKMAAKYPNIRYYHSNGISKWDKIFYKADLILFKTDSLGHTAYTKAKTIAVKKGIAYGYVENVTSVELLARSVYQHCVKFGLEGAVAG